MIHGRRIALAFAAILLIVVKVYAEENLPFSSAYDVAWSQDGTLLAVGTSEGLLFYHPVTHMSELLRDVRGGANLVWSADGSQLLSGLTIVNRETKQVESLRISGGRVFGWSEDGEYLVAVIHNSQDIGILDAHTLQLIETIVIDRGEITSVSWSPDETRFAVTIPNGSVLIVSNSANPTIIEYPQDPTAIRVSWSPLGDMLAIGTVAHTVWIWDAKKQEIIHTFDGQGANRFDWSPDGGLLAASNLDGTLTVWDIETGTVVDSLQTFGYLNDAAFSPYGGMLAVATDITNALLYRPTPTSQAHDVRNAARWNQTLGTDGAVQIIVPAPSLERLRRLTERCGMTTSVEGQVLAQAETSHLPAFIQQVKSLSNDQIPPGCAADLIAVAQALQARRE